MTRDAAQRGVTFAACAWAVLFGAPHVSWPTFLLGGVLFGAVAFLRRRPAPA